MAASNPGNPGARSACEPLLPEIENLKIYVGNMPYSVTSEDLSDMFKEYGGVEEATVIMDRETGRAKGFGFVDMPNNSDADRAIKALNGTQLEGRALTVNQARPRESRPARGSFFPTVVTRADQAGHPPISLMKGGSVAQQRLFQ